MRINFLYVSILFNNSTFINIKYSVYSILAKSDMMLLFKFTRKSDKNFLLSLAYSLAFKRLSFFIFLRFYPIVQCCLLYNGRLRRGWRNRNGSRRPPWVNRMVSFPFILFSYFLFRCYLSLYLCCDGIVRWNIGNKTYCLR